MATTERKRPNVGSLGTTFVLAVVEGPDLGSQLTLDGAGAGRALVGQSAACDLRLSDPLVSRRHLALDACGTVLKLVDLRSRNRTFVNGVDVVEANLVGGELVRIGDTSLRVERTAGPLPAGDTRDRFGRTLGRSDAMRRIYPVCDRLTMSNVPVVIEGETGTGKELLAECLHEAGPRKQGPFIVFDCAAVSMSEVEATLFGIERAGEAPRVGVFELATGGTLLVDEIGELDASMQPLLLRAIDRGEIVRLGSSARVKTDVRLIATTRRDLDREVQEGRFRDDLFYRLAVTRVELPPLRRRREDIALLATHFWRALARDGSAPPADLAERFADLEWPGNVRELANAVARRFALGDLAPAATAGASHDAAAPPPAGVASASGGAARGGQGSPNLVEDVLALDLPLTQARERVVAEFERRYVARVLANHGGNVARAAEASGLARRYFQILRARQQTK